MAMIGQFGLRSMMLGLPPSVDQLPSNARALATEARRHKACINACAR
jgi:hypothetical protein